MILELLNGLKHWFLPSLPLIGVYNSFTVLQDIRSKELFGNGGGLSREVYFFLLLNDSLEDEGVD